MSVNSPTARMPIFLCLDLLFYKIFKSDYKKMGILAVGLLSLIYLGLTVRQNYYWRAEVPLFERVVKYENFGRIHFLLGRAYYFDQKYDAAIQELNTGIAIMQSYLDKIKDPSAKPFYLGFIKEMGFDLDRILEYMRHQAYLTRGVTYMLRDEREESAAKDGSLRNPHHACANVR